MKAFNFDLQKFVAFEATENGAVLVMSEGETYTHGGIIYTAQSEQAGISLDLSGKVTGLASGIVQAKVVDLENSATLTLNSTGGTVNFSAESNGRTITVTTLFPIELINGNFTYNGSTLNISAGSDLAIVSQRDNYSLRNENHFVYDSSYNLSNYALISNAECVISKFALTNGEGTRELNLEQLGTVINNFAERGVTLVEGSSEALILGDYTLMATATNGNAGLNFDLNESGMTFVPNTGDGKLKVALNRNDAEIISGILECTNGNITFGYDHAVTFEEGTSFNFAWNNYVSTITANGNASTAIALTENGITFTPGSGDGGLNLLLTKDGTPIFAGNLNITDGTITFNTDEQKFSFSEGTKISLGIGTDGSRAMDFQIVGGSASFKVAADNSGNFTITPDNSDGSLSIAMKQNGATVFQNNLSVNGAIVINPVTDLLTLKDGTSASFSFNNYTLTATADGDASSKISMTAGGISFMPQTGDGTLKIALGSSNGAMTAEIEVLSGGFLFGANGSLNVVEGTELQIKFSDDYIVNFKTTDAAGGSISIGDGGLNFAPNSDDGDLQLSITRNGETRTASLDVNGSLTYKLDGSISLAEGTVVRNVFEDGNILTITANTDASGAIVFNPQTGLSITPSTPDALNIVLTTDGLDVVNISSITGTVTYSNGLVTASDGTQAHLSVYDTWESELRTSGGSASLRFTGDRTVYTANEGATFVLDYLDGSVLEIQNGSFTDIYATETSDAIELISAGSIFYSNDDEFIFTLATAGNYTLNGMKVTTTSDNVQVKLGSVVVDGITYTPLDENIRLTLGENGATASGGKVNLQMDGFESIFGFDLTDGAVSYSNGKFTIKSGAKTYLNNGNFPTAFVAQNDFTIQVTPKDDGLYAFSFPDGAADFALVSNGVTVIESSLTLNGEILVNPQTHEMFLTQGTNFILGKDGRILQITALDTAGGQMTMTESGIRFAPNENDGALEFNFLLPGRKATLDVTGAFTYGGLGRMSLEDGTQATFTWEDGNKLQLNSHGSTGSISLDFNKGIGITSADENLDMSFTDASSGYTTTISSIQGTIWYNAGKVIIDENTKLTGSGSFGGQSVDVTLEAIDGYGFLQFGSSGVTYGAGTDDLRITLSRDGLASTFTIKKGEILIGHNIFNIAVGSDISTDLQSLIPALSFMTTDPGEYTINGQTITTSAANLALTATDNQMVFKTSSDAIEYDGMTFAGNGNVTLSPAAVTLGNGVIANGFGEGNTFVLTEQGTVVADEKVFELTEPVATGISVKGAQDGFIFSRMLTQESEERLGYYNSPDIGKIFSEEFHSAGDSSYRIETDLIGLEKVSGISNGATITGGATLNDENTLSYYVLDTDTNGKFTIGEKTYTLNDDNQVGAEIRAYFNGGTAYADRINNLNGVVSGDFTGGEFKINDGSSMQVFGDDNVSIYANENYQEIFGLDDRSSLKVLGAGTYVVNSTTLELSGTNFIVGNEDGSARILYESFFENNSNDVTLSGSELNEAFYNFEGANTQIYGYGGSDTITNTHAYYVTIDGGAGDDLIDIYRGHHETIFGGEGNDTINGLLGSLEDSSSDWAMGGYASIDGGAGDDLINTGYSNDSEIYGGEGNDTIITTGLNSTVDGGAGSNLIQITTPVRGSRGDFVVLHGNTTVEGFQTGFGEGADALYVTQAPPAVDFFENGLTFYSNTDTVTFSDIHNTAKIDIYHTQNPQVTLASAVVFAENEWYTVTDNDLAIRNGYKQGLYFVGATATPNHGVDFSNITQDVNVTLNTEYELDDVHLWINNVHSIKGGAGNTTITGSTDNDTIFAGTGATTINAKAGDDYIVLNSEEADNGVLINYTPGEGNDTIIGFGANDTLKIDGEAYSVKSGNDLIVTVGDNRITLVDGVNISNPNIDADKNPLVELTEVILKRTEAGYPVMAAIAFSPDETIAPEATNYAAKEDWNITSSDNLNLHAVHYTPENSNDKWVMLIHGYGNNHTAMYPYLSSYLNNGYNVLMIDQRAAGESEGEWLTMGVAESADVALWTQEIARRNSNAKITLHGVSMGAATAMLAAARPDAVNITSIVEDCGYSNVMDTFGLVNDAVLHQPAEVIQALDPISASLTGYYLHDAAPINSISSVTVPSLFISGSEDAVAPVSMLSALYEASGAAVKEQYIVDGSPHALAIVYDPAGYNNALFSFVAEADGEGVYIDNVTDSISLRGTSYNDTILTNGANVTIDAGAGENIVSLSGGSETVIFSGKTTVEGFQTGFTTGFGDGVDALYIEQSPPGVEFFESGLTFLSSTDSVTFSDIHHTAKIDLYHTQNPQVTLASAVVLAEDEWYSVTDNDLAMRNDYKQGLYFVGGTPTANHGVDFSNIAQDVNVTVDTEYELEDVHLWINNVHSIKGGAGNTSITGSTDNDTIFSGGGQTSLWGSKGDDYLAGGAGYDTFIYKLGDGNDNIQNAGAGDLIFLSDISMDQILSANITPESVTLNFSDGGSINISGTGAIYQLANGSRYSADHENLSWQTI